MLNYIYTLYIFQLVIKYLYSNGICKTGNLQEKEKKYEEDLSGPGRTSFSGPTVTGPENDEG